MIRHALIADDDDLSREYLAEALRASGIEVSEAVDGRDAQRLFDADRHDLVFSDLRMPGGNGIEVLQAVKTASPRTPVVLVTAYGSVECAVQAMRDGAEDFIVKPFTPEQVDAALDRVRARMLAADESRPLAECPSSAKVQVTQSVGSSARWTKAMALARRVARTRVTVLVRGESGTGKEVVASALHAWSDRSDAAFVRTNCAVLHDSLLSSELFGHEKGAFTGAHVRKEGRFELAHGGTLFLDEIGEISPEIQAKLLRVLETGEFERVGGKETLRVDVRVICATNRDLEGMIADGRFREDLYYRLNVVPIELPALRERPEDISPLFRHFVEKYSREQDTRPLNIDQAMIETLQAMPWPGNVRELANVAQRCVLIGDASPVTASLRQRTAAGAESKTHELVGRTIADVERELILATLDRTRSNKTEAARLLGVTARTLSNKIKFWRAHGLLPAGMEL